MTRFRVEVVEPTSLLSQVQVPRAAFEEIWQLIPQDSQRRLWRFLDCDGGLFVKGLAAPWRPNRESLWRSRRLIDEQRRLVQLTTRGLPFPRIVAWGAERQFGVVRRSFLAMRLFHDVVDLEAYLLTGQRADDDLSDKATRSREVARESRRRRTAGEERCVTPVEEEQRAAVLDAVGRAVGELHAARAFHRDLSPRNVLLRLPSGGARTDAPGAPRPEVAFIDCPRAILDPPGPVHSALRRSELYRLTRGVRRTGATREECARLLDAAGGADLSATILDFVDRQGASRRRPRAVTWWYFTGHAR